MINDCNKSHLNITSYCVREKTIESRSKTIKVMFVGNCANISSRQVECFGKSSVELLLFSNLIGIVK